MMSVGTALGTLAMLGASVSASLGLMPEPASVCHGGRDLPEEPAAPAACHAVTECAAHRKLRTFP